GHGVVGGRDYQTPLLADKAIQVTGDAYAPECRAPFAHGLQLAEEGPDHWLAGRSTLETGTATAGIVIIGPVNDKIILRQFRPNRIVACRLDPPTAIAGDGPVTITEGE